jgi:Predicted membrane protein (DUF2207)
MAASLTPPADLRPAQLGIVLVGRVILGHIGATLVDLAQRGFLRIDDVPGDDGHDSLLTDLRGRPAARDGLQRFEATLLDGLFAQQPVFTLREISQDLVPTLNRVRTQIHRDAVRQGWLRRWPRDRRSAQGEQLLRQIQAFRRDMRTLMASGDSVEIARLAPYAILFGLSAPPTVRFAAGDTKTAQRHETEIKGSQTDLFATQWTAACEGLARSPDGVGDGRSDDFVHSWSAPRGHGHGSHGHDVAHGGYGGGYEHLGGGHGGGLGGGHGGH